MIPRALNQLIYEESEPASPLPARFNILIRLYPIVNTLRGPRPRCLRETDFDCVWLDQAVDEDTCSLGV